MCGDLAGQSRLVTHTSLLPSDTSAETNASVVHRRWAVGSMQGTTAFRTFFLHVLSPYNITSK